MLSVPPEPSELTEQASLSEASSPFPLPFLLFFFFFFFLRLA